ncbi:FAFR343Cp [Eremothecium gossypii FDAG1]|nr:FAFR343Cp [Eremothecium gossypii FDAG1]
MAQLKWGAGRADDGQDGREVDIEERWHGGAKPDSADGSRRIQIQAVNDEDDTSELITFNQDVSWFIVMLTFVASLSGFLFGYDTGYISSALQSVGTDLGHQLTYRDKEYITSATSLGALIAALGAGICADLFGRRKCIMFSNILFVVGTVLQVAAFNFWQMVVGRLVMGFGIGFGSLISPLFISEIAPKMIRGRLTVINSLWLTGGQLIAYACGAGFQHVKHGWRILVGISMLPAVLQFVFFIFLPDTPRFYVMKGRLEDAANVLERTYVGAERALIDRKIEELVLLNKTIPGRTVFHRVWNTIVAIHTVPANLRALIIACGLQGIQQFCGWNSLMYFSGDIFSLVGFKDPVAVSIVVAATNFIFTLVAFFAIDKIGRRIILLIGLPGMTTAMTVCAIAFHYIKTEVDGEKLKPVGESNAWGIVVVIFIIVYAAFYALGIGTVPWQQSELFPQPVRGVGTSFATATNWAGSMVIASTFLTMFKNITPTATFGFFAGISVISLVAVYLCYPELSGLELEEVQFVLKDGFNIKASKALAKKRKFQMAESRKQARELDLESLHKAKPSDEFTES